MVLTLVLTVSFCSSENFASAFGIAVALTMLLTSEAILGDNSVEVVSEVLDRKAPLWGHAGSIGGDHMQQHDTFVKDLIVLQIVQQRYRHHVEPAGHIDRGSWHTCLGAHLSDEIGERQRVALKLVRQGQRGLDARWTSGRKGSPPTTSGTQPPCITFIMLAVTKDKSTTTNRPATAALSQRLQPHTSRIARKISIEVSSIVSATAIPKAEADSPTSGS